MQFQTHLRDKELTDRVLIHSGSSLELLPDTIRNKIGPINIFSVDGCHTYTSG